MPNSSSASAALSSSHSSQIIPQRLALLRQHMASNGIHACLIPSADPHLSEYLPARWQGRAWFSGFTGSVGTLIVTTNFAGLWVDTRYWVQAEQDLIGTGVQMMKIASAGATDHIDWLAANLNADQTVSVDGMILSLAIARQLEQSLSARQIKLNTKLDLLNAAWPDRPSLPTEAVFEHGAPYAVQSRSEKLALVRAAMQELGADAHLISSVDDIAWLLNLRGSDVSYNPVFLAHALINQEHVELFIGKGKIPAELQSALAAQHIHCRDYQQITSALAELPSNSTLLVEPRRVTLGILESCPASVKKIDAINPSTFLKSRKSSAEVQHIRNTMEQDGAALCEFFAWFDNTIGKQVITEMDVDTQICAARAKRPDFVSPSFGTIAGFNANGAMPHYHATPESNTVIEGNGFLLIDSGGQYLGGTTDITRVVAIGQPSAEQKRDFALELKSVIALSVAQFPVGTRAPLLDAIARAPMWAAGLNYGHGTGHGVGYFLNVHEGPHNISWLTPPEPQTAMQLGMITSIEPGIYRPGKWGIRIENLVLNVPGDSTEFGEFIRFETLTLCPIDTRCLDKSHLTQVEIDWINNYHATVKQRLTPLVTGDALAWLERSTVAI
ncbi:aminopeptidase P family protein [Solimicrobium silvestre]|uniref:Metallopeptidase family M24 n=1 Tax=Solimicrobium silvestre TaxID=2099400 RepID=A0A2S9GVZ7_9BURK|nr:aminopeptidase P family protein [Solimicrobium silvestre]PRC91868.1 Metallopeptidase family M24 [Solimicrobium silvestre]